MTEREKSKNISCCVCFLPAKKKKEEDDKAMWKMLSLGMVVPCTQF